MRKIISVLSLLSIISSDVLTFGTNINSKIQTNHHINLLNNNKNKDNISTGFHFYEPNIKVNNLDDNPLANSGLSLQEQQYCDFVFLKSLYADADNDKAKTTISIDYSFSNLITYDNKNDIEDITQDQKDFQIMQNYKDAYGHIGIAEGQSLLNRYLNNGLLSFNQDGYIPPRNVYFNSLLKNNSEQLQTVIIDNYNPNNLYNKDLSNYLSVSLNWYGVNLKIGYKLADSIIYGLINFSVKTAFFTLGVAIYAGKEFLEEKIHAFIKEGIEEDLRIIAIYTLELDTEAPEVAAIIMGISAILAKLICDEINKQLDDLVAKSINFLDDLNNVIENKLQAFEGKQKLAIEFDTTWILIGSKIKIDLLDNEPVITENTLTPSQINPLMPHTDLLVGNTNDFIAIFNADDWSVISDSIFMGYTVIDYINNELGLKNPNINLTENDWINIDSLMLHSSLGDSVKPGYSFLMHVVKIDGEFKILYTNLQSDSTTNMPYIDAGRKIKELFAGELNNNNLILTNDQFSILMSAYNYDENNWEDIKNKNHPSENNADDYFYNNSISNNFFIDNFITKQQILIEIKNFNNAIYIPNSIKDPYIKKTFTFSQFVAISENNKNILNIPSNIGIDGVKH